MPKPTHGREKVRSQVEADAKTDAARRVCHAGWQLSNRRWVVYLPQQSQARRPVARTARITRRAAKGRMAACDRVCAQLGNESAHSELVAGAI
jgi:hypothetical protein